MDTKINFFKIGLFIVVSTALLLGVVFWLGKYGFEDKKFDKYAIYFKESISGLNVGSTVKYRGFEVGSVEEIKINPNNSEEIQLDIIIKKEVPIKADIYAVLGNLGITGLKYIELKGGSNSSELLKPNESGLRVIPSKTSMLASLEESTAGITSELLLVLVQIKKALNDENINNFSQTMGNIEQISSHLNDNQKIFDELFINMNKFVKTGSESFETMSSSATTVKASAAQFQELSKKLMDNLEDGSFDIKQLSQESFEKLNIVLDSLENTMEKSQRLIDNLNQSPSDIIFKQKDIKYGPGESNEK
ncbi:MlaD family protein [uncultured Arcobacter sp.]|uniref:MlaD family protein n=1 Tax=uncultured Arcobacter sp. TaxID=165434 RepID=UPI002612801B|nr:MlaD family protein [uncultured Arcobacter sp.]